MEKTWAVQDAKARFSEFLREAENEPQIISYRGKPKFEVRLIKETRKSKRKRRAKSKRKPMTLVDWWLSAPKIPGFKVPPRPRDKPKKVF
ncbi:MAG: type II toxin-antitoxin system Phd/YefM family antitoxin [Rhizomicrobium sp.]